MSGFLLVCRAPQVMVCRPLLQQTARHLRDKHGTGARPALAGGPVRKREGTQGRCPQGLHSSLRRGWKGEPIPRGVAPKLLFLPPHLPYPSRAPTQPHSSQSRPRGQALGGHCAHAPQQVGGPDDGQVAGVHVGLCAERGHVHQVAHQEFQGPAERAPWGRGHSGSHGAGVGLGPGSRKRRGQSRPPAEGESGLQVGRAPHTCSLGPAVLEAPPGS